MGKNSNAQNIYTQPVNIGKNNSTTYIKGGFRYYVIALVIMFAMNSQKAQAWTVYIGGWGGSFLPPTGTDPYYLGPNAFQVCEDGGSLSIDSFFQIAVMEDALPSTDTSVTVTWSVVTAPLHGTLVATYSTSISFIAGTYDGEGWHVPPDFTYTPNPGYSGLDSFTEQVLVDGSTGYTTPLTIYVHVLFPSAGTITGASSVCAGSTITLTDAATGGAWSSSNTAATCFSGVITGVLAGVDTISYTATDYCGIATTAKIITVNTFPVTGTITGASVVCAGASITLTDVATGGAWSSSNSSATVLGGTVTSVTAGIDTIKYTVSNSCGTASAEKTVTVNPIPGITPSSNQTVCNGATTAAINFTGSVPGTVFSWTNTNTGIGLPSSGTGNIASFMATNPFTAPISSTITVSTAANGCTGTSNSFTITINPTPLLVSSSAPPAICSGTLFSYLPTSPTAGVIFSWYRALISGISNPAASGTGNINETLINSTTTPIPVTYAYALNASGCTNVQNVTVTVNPFAVLSSPLTTPAICSGTLFSYSPTSAIPGMVFSWNRPLISGLSNPAASGTGNISETLINLTSSPLTVTYVYTLTVNGCTNTQNVTVVVIPQPIVATITGSVNVCVGSSITLTDGISGGIWSASNSNATVGSTGSLSGVVTGITVGIDTIRYTTSNSCGSATATKPIAINPLPNAGTITGTTNVCVGSGITLTESATGGIWSASNGNATVGPTGSLSGLVTGAAAGMDTIRYAVTNTCGTIAATKIITVNPLPNAGTITGSVNVCVSAAITLADGITGGSWSASNSNATVGSTGPLSGLVTGVTAGADTISYSITNTCGTAMATKTITINPLPDAGTITGIVNVCVSSGITLTESVTGGAWSASNGHAMVGSTGSLSSVVTGVTAGVDTIIYSITNTCGMASAIRNITVNPLPNAGTISGSSSVCMDSAITLTDGIGGGVWSASNSASSVSGGLITGVSAGTDTINYAVTNICGTATTAKIITINPLPIAGAITGASSVCAGSVILLTESVTTGLWSSSNSLAAVFDGAVTGVSAGPSVINYSVTNLCGTVAATKSIIVSNPPLAGIITGPVTVCADSIIILADTATGGTWSSVNT